MRFGHGYYAKEHFDFSVGADDADFRRNGGPEFQERVPVGRLPRIFERLAGMGWELVTSFGAPEESGGVVFVFRNEE